MSKLYVCIVDSVMEILFKMNGDLYNHIKWEKPYVIAKQTHLDVKTELHTNEGCF